LPVLTENADQPALAEAVDTLISDKLVWFPSYSKYFDTLTPHNQRVAKDYNKHLER